MQLLLFIWRKHGLMQKLKVVFDNLKSIYPSTMVVMFNYEHTTYNTEK